MKNQQTKKETNTNEPKTKRQQRNQMEARAEPLRETIKDETTTKRKGASRPMKTQQTRWSRISQQRTVIFDTASLFFCSSHPLSRSFFVEYFFIIGSNDSSTPLRKPDRSVPSFFFHLFCLFVCFFYRVSQ